jgi:large subunit ribosomal protein L21
MYAIIRTGGKQYRVEANRNIRVEKIGGEAGSRMALNEVMMIGGDNAVMTVLKVLEILRPGQVSSLSSKAEVAVEAVEAKKPAVKKAAAKVQKDESVSVQSDQAE